MASRSLAILVVVAGIGATAAAQPAPQKIRVGIYAPSVEFGTAQARLAYVQGLAKAIEQNTGIKTEAQSYASVAALKSDNVDYAIIDGPCYAVNLNWKLVANASIGGAVSRTWALYSSAGDTMQALKGKKLAFVATGCNDAGFVDNAMLESEVDAQFFGARNGEKDLTGAIAAVSSYKTAQAVFAPVGAVKGLAKLFDTGNVPNPAFVEVAGKLPAAIGDKVSAAVVGYGGSGAISGWTKPTREPFLSLSGRLGRVVKTGILANPEPVRLDAREVLVDPTTLKDAAFVAVRHHFVRPPGARME
jgi:hypothetical protein